MSLDRKILERIERENIKIRPEWFFAVKNFVFGTGTILISILGSISLALLFDISAQQGKSMTWLSAPYLWAVLFAIFLMGSYWLVTKIDLLYRVRFVPIMGMLLCISLSFGYLTFANGKAEEIRLELEKIPIYDVIAPTSKDLPGVGKKPASSYNEDIKQEEGEEDKNRNKDEEDYDKQDKKEGGDDESDFETESEDEDELERSENREDGRDEVEEEDWQEFESVKEDVENGSENTGNGQNEDSDSDRDDENDEDLEEDEVSEVEDSDAGEPEEIDEA